MDQGLMKISLLEISSFLEYSNFNKIAVIVLSPDYIVTNFNEKAKDIYSWETTEILNKSYFNWFRQKGFVEPISIEDLENAKSGKPKLNVEKPSVDGKSFFLWNVVANTDEKDLCNCLILSAVDVTTQKNLEHEMAKQKSGNKAIYAMSKEVMGYDIGEERPALEYISSIYTYLEKIISHMPCYVYWKNKEFVYLGCNDLTADLLKLPSKRTIIGKTDYDFGWDIEKVNEYRKIDEYIVKTGRSQLNFEETITKSDGSVTVLLVNKMPIFDETGRIIGIVGISIDITERKQIEREILIAKEQAEIANNAKTEFLENMRHDIRTSLTSIVGFSDLLIGETDKNKLEKYAVGLSEASKELLRFLNEVLESINVSSGELPLLKKKFSLRETLENVIKLNQPVALEKQLELRLAIDNNIPKYLIGDSVRIYRVVLELLVNSLKFTQEGHVNVFAKLGSKEGKDVTVQIFIEDTGLGIPPERQQDLFIRFKRLTASYQGIYKGAGLGLSIVKQFIDDLQGEIYVESKPKQGTKFVCVIPLKEPLLEEPFNNSTFVPFSNREAAIPSKNENKVINGGNSKKYGLIVEDQSIAALVAKELLIGQGCEVDIVEDGETAIKQVQKRRYDFILMDIGLPGLNGYEVTKNIRLLEENTQHQTFIIGLTGHADEEKKRLGLNAGMNVVLSKPLTSEMSACLVENFILNSVENVSFEKNNSNRA